jgi:hypothetical protein
MKGVTAMTTSTNAALAFVLASYAKSEPQEGTVTFKEPKASKPRANKAPKVQAAPVAPKASNPSPNGATSSVVMPEAGSLEAKGFLLMMRNAKTQNEKIMAIAAYVGYNAREAFGNQEMVATMRAQRELRPIDTTGPSREETRQAARSAAGYVAGMPDNQRKIVLDLLARERAAAEKRDEHVKIARTNKSLSWEERKLNIGLARLENERLASIRADLAKWVG